MNIIFKILGSVFVITASSAAGFYVSNINNYRINDLEEFKKALMILKSEIEFSINSLPEAMRAIALKTDKKTACFFKYIADRLNEKKGDGISVIWEDALVNSLKKTYMAEEDKDYFKALGNTLGYMDRKLQINNIQIIVEYIDSKIEFLQKANETNKKLYSSLGVLGGLLVVVVML